MKNDLEIKNETAIMLLNEIKDGRFCLSHTYVDAIDIAIDSLENEMDYENRTIPRKVVYVMKENGNRQGLCPRCLNDEGLYDGQKFCGECGQAIRWEPTTPEEFADMALKIQESITFEPDEKRIRINSIVCNLLCELGYDKGAKIFSDYQSW